jgi:hypothetical protein
MKPVVPHSIWKSRYVLLQLIEFIPTPSVTKAMFLDINLFIKFFPIDL